MWYVIKNVNYSSLKMYYLYFNNVIYISITTHLYCQFSNSNYWFIDYYLLHQVDVLVHNKYPYIICVCSSVHRITNLAQPQMILGKIAFNCKVECTLDLCARKISTKKKKLWKILMIFKSLLSWKLIRLQNHNLVKRHRPWQTEQKLNKRKQNLIYI